MEKNWLGWQDSNLRMPVPKTGALPLGDTPAVPLLGESERPYSERKSEGNAPNSLFPADYSTGNTQPWVSGAVPRWISINRAFSF